MVKETVLDFANKISRTKRGTKNEVTSDGVEYRILEPIVTEEMAEMGMYLQFREPKSAEEISKECRKNIEEVEELLWELALAGGAVVNEIDGVNKYWIELWVPGHMEMIVNNRENVKKYPQLGAAFEEFSKKKGPMAAGNIPIGSGPMRVIPIERSINAETRTASYEEVKKYLDENTVFSVSDCACRTAREAMGEGCGHLKEDMCIQMADAARYYIKTGRGREITREEAFEIIQRAEDNGLMHNIPNVEGPGKTHAICNCCGCSCLALRHANLWRNPDMVRSNFISKVDKDKCVGCGECVENCPTNALKVGQKLCSENQGEIEVRELPYDMKWGEDKWNPEYRTNRKVVMDTGSSPCKAECPAHIGVQGYIKLASMGKYKEALQLIKEENPFPAICGRVCPRYCESECTRGDVDEPIAIDEIKRFIADQDMNKEHRFIPRVKHDYGKKIAVVGSGPAGLACAYYLAIEGYKVTVFEKEKILGGMLTLGIPSFRLQKNVVNSEIDVLREIGVEFKTGINIGKDITIDQLREQGYEAFYLAIGAQGGRILGISNEDANGVISGIDFLKKVNCGKEVKLEGDTIIIGGGNVAIDVARTAARLGEGSIKMFCLESREEMPALLEEIEEAENEDIIINNSWGPGRIIVEDNRVAGVEFKRCVSVFDGEGNFKPKFDNEDTLIVEADNLIISIGQSIEWGNLLERTKLEINKNGTVKADGVTFQTGEQDIFTGGDIYTGPKFAIDAISMGKEGAISIHRFVNNGQSLTLGRLNRNYRAFDKSGLKLEGYDTVAREKACHNKGVSTLSNFEDTRVGFTEEQVKKETERCLGCGATVSDEFMCIGCGMCVTKCKFDAIKLQRKYDKATPEFEKMKSTVIRYALKRKVRIAVNTHIKGLKKFLKNRKEA